jgi:transposase
LGSKKETRSSFAWQAPGRPLGKPLYNPRWHAEIGFSQHKRRLGSALTTRHDGAQGREIVLRVITHNLMLIAEAA